MEIDPRTMTLMEQSPIPLSNTAPYAAPQFIPNEVPVMDVNAMASAASQMPTGLEDDTDAIIKRVKKLKDSGLFDTPFEKARKEHPIMTAIAQAMLGMGQGMSKQPFLTNKMDNQAALQKQSMDMIGDLVKSNQMNPYQQLIAATRAQNMGLREDQFRQGSFQKMGDDLDPAKSVRNALGVGKLGIARTERIEGLANRYKDLNLDRREIEEMAIGLNSVLQGSNVSAQQQVQALVPKSARGNIAAITEWLSNEPQGTQQQKFVERMLNDVRREKQVMQNQVHDMLVRKVPKYNTLREKYPNDWEDVLRGQGIDPVKYDAWRKGGYKKQDVVGIFDLSDQQVDSPVQNVTAPISQWDNSKEQRYQELLKKRGN